MSRALWVTGDTLEVARQLPDSCVDLIVTSPPFLALRSYLPDDDPAKALEIGQETTPGAYLDMLLDLVVEWRRILTPHGSLCVELGDTYSGSGGHGGDYAEGGMREGQPRFDGSASKRYGTGAAPRPARPRRKQPPNTAHRVNDDGSLKTSAERRRTEAKNAEQILPVTGGPGWPLDKSLCLIPQLFAVAMSYGVNPLTGRTLEPWRVRNVVRWCRPNPPVGALGDKFRPATSEMLIACTGNKRWFDLDAVRTEPVTGDRVMYQSTQTYDPQRSSDQRSQGERMQANNPAGAPPLDFWVIPTHPYKGSHYATFPPALVVRPVEAMCPRKVCQTCGQPSERITSEPTYEGRNDAAATPLHMREGERRAEGVNQWNEQAAGDRTAHRVTETLGWSDCGHNAWRPGRVLDPFGGSGTTLEVATGHGRDGIGIDLDRRNAGLARERIGGLFFTELTASELAAELASTGEVAA